MYLTRHHTWPKKMKGGEEFGLMFSMFGSGSVRGEFGEPEPEPNLKPPLARTRNLTSAQVRFGQLRFGSGSNPVRTRTPVYFPGMEKTNSR